MRAWRSLNERRESSESERAEDPPEQAVLPIGWHCVQRRGARPSSALVVSSRLISATLVAFRPFPSRWVCIAAPRRAAPCIPLPLPSPFPQHSALLSRFRVWYTYVLHRVFRYLSLSSRHLYSLAGVARLSPSSNSMAFALSGYAGRSLYRLIEFNISFDRMTVCHILSYNIPIMCVYVSLYFS